MKALLKQVVYSLKPYAIPEKFKLCLGYVFHTEMVYNDKYFQDLLEFCRQFTAITGKKPVCTVMAATSPKVAAGMQETGCSSAELAARYKQLAGFATLGYHGHFYLNPEHYLRKETELRSNNFVEKPLAEQFNRDLAWFEANNLAHNGLYAGGWWFMNKSLLALLIKNGFKYDFSFSKHLHFINQFSQQLMLKYNIPAGKNFAIEVAGAGRITEIQNLVGAPGSPFFQDFSRHMLHLLEANSPDVTGFINSHDYDLDLGNTIKLFKTLSTLPNVTFFDGEDILAGKLRPQVLVQA